MDQAESIKVQLARINCVDFVEYVFGWTVADFQAEWQEAASKHKRLLLFASVEHGKSSQLSIGRALWEIGNDLEIRIALIMNTAPQAQKFSGVIREIITGNSEEAQRFRRVFPWVKPGTGVYKKWDTEGIIVDRRGVKPDYTMVALGVGKEFLGSRFDLILFDDPLNLDNTSTDTQRDKIWKWMRSTALTRLVDDGRAIFITTAWHIEDAAHRAEESGVWYTIKTPAIEVLPSGEPNWDGAVAWPIQWPSARLKDKYREVGSIEFARQFLCQALSDTISRFKESSINFALNAGKQYGITQKYIPESQKDGTVINDCVVYVGVDLAVGKREDHDQTAIVIGCVIPDGDIPKRRILDIRMGRYEGDSILDQLAMVKEDYPKCMGAYVENNAAQDYLVQFGRKRDDLPPIYGFTTTAQKKYDPKFGIPGLSVELDGGLWIFPSLEKEDTGELSPKIRHLITGLRTWSPRDHTFDDVIGMWLLSTAINELYGACEVKTDVPRESFGPIVNRFSGEEKPQHHSEGFFS